MNGQIFELPRDVRSVNAMRVAINMRAIHNHSPESDRIRAVCEGVRLMVLGRSSSAAVALGKKLLGEDNSYIPHRGDAA